MISAHWDTGMTSSNLGRWCSRKSKYVALVRESWNTCGPIKRSPTTESRTFQLNRVWNDEFRVLNGFYWAFWHQLCIFSIPFQVKNDSPVHRIVLRKWYSSISRANSQRQNVTRFWKSGRCNYWSVWSDMDDTGFCSKHTYYFSLWDSCFSRKYMRTHVWIFLLSVYFILLNDGGEAISAHFVHVTKKPVSLGFSWIAENTAWLGVRRSG